MKKDINFYISAFISLRRDSKMGGAPHKLILLLSILDAFEYQKITDNRVFITPELIGLFKSNWATFVITEHAPRFALPAGRTIVLPNDTAHFPDTENLKWHLENIFEKGR